MHPAITTLAALLAVPALARDPRGAEGDANTTTQRREVAAFDAIDLEGAADVSVRVGGERAVSVTTDADLQDRLRIEVRRGMLVIRSEGELRPHGPTRVEVAVPALRKLALSGSGHVAVDGGSGPMELSIDGSGDLRWKGEASELRTSVEGSGDVRLEGRADRLQVSVEGSGGVDAGQLRARDVAATVEGSGDVLVNVDGGSLAATVAGSGDVHWRGVAKVESVTISGSGSVGRKD